MTPARFLEIRAGSWRRLEELLGRAGRRGASALSGPELHELSRLYPAVAADVARARMFALSAAQQQHINALAIQAHGLLYRRRGVRPLGALKRFFVSDYPKLFRQLRGYFLLALAIFGGATLASYATTRLDPRTAYIFVPAGLDISGAEEVTAEDVSERYRRMHKGLMASFITTNNIQVAFLAFALGITAGLGTCYVLLANGMMLGAFFGHFANHRLSYELWSFLTPHGALEIFAILVAGAAGLRMGLALAIPGPRTRGASLRHGAREAVMLLMGTIPMFLVAGMIESYITPSYLPGSQKILLGVGTLTAAAGYLLIVGRGPQPVRAGATP